MNLNLATTDDLINIKSEIIAELKKCIQEHEKADTWLKNSDVRKILGCSEGTLINLRASGKLPYSKIKGTIYFRKSDLNRLFNSHIVN